LYCITKDAIHSRDGLSLSLDQVYRSTTGDLERTAVESAHFSYPQVADPC
jgi:hypothetical protein